MARKFPKYNEEWGKCQTCGFDTPKSQLRWHPKWGWQCTGGEGANCYDGPVDRDMQLAKRKFRKGEGVRKSKTPITNTDTEGL